MKKLRTFLFCIVCLSVFTCCTNYSQHQTAHTEYLRTFTSIASVALILSLSILLLVYIRRSVLKQNALLIVENERIKLEIHNAKLQHENHLKEWSNCLLLYIAGQQGSVDNALYKISISKEVENNKNMKDVIEKTKVKYQNDRKSRIKSLTDNELFLRISGLTTEEAQHFNHSEKMLLALLISGFTNEETALILSCSSESVRVRTANLQKKIMPLGIHTAYLPNETL